MKTIENYREDITVDVLNNSKILLNYLYNEIFSNLDDVKKIIKEFKE